MGALNVKKKQQLKTKKHLMPCHDIILEKRNLFLIGAFMTFTMTI